MKKLLIAAAMVALMASSSFAAISLDLIGVAGVGNNVSQSEAAALSFDITKDLSLAIGLGTSTHSKPDGYDSEIADTILYGNGYYTIMRKGDVSQAVGLELYYETMSNRDVPHDPINWFEINGNYRVAVSVTPGLRILFDVEALSIRQYCNNTIDAGLAHSNVTILNGAKIGFSVPVM